MRGATREESTSRGERHASPPPARTSPVRLSTPLLSSDDLAARTQQPVICIILAAGLESALEREIKTRPDLSHLHGLHRALLPVDGVAILNHWNRAIMEQREIESTYIVSSGAKFKQVRVSCSRRERERASPSSACVKQLLLCDADVAVAALPCSDPLTGVLLLACRCSRATPSPPSLSLSLSLSHSLSLSLSLAVRTLGDIEWNSGGPRCKQRSLRPLADARRCS